LVDLYGLDTLEAGNAIAMAMELYEKGILTNEHTEGLRLEWGDDQLVLDLIRKISFREGKLANLLAEGPVRMVEKLGPEAAYSAIHCKGLANLQSDERATPSFALGIATSTRGADHLRSRPAYDLYGLPEDVLEKVAGGPQTSDYTSYVGKSKLVWYQELLYSVTDALGTCKFQTRFLGFNMPNWDEFSKLIYLTSGLEISKAELMDIGERIYTIERLFNIREGFTRADDTLPERYFTEPNPIGLPIARGKKIEREQFEKMLDEYYELHKWDENGVPKEEMLKRLKMDKEPSHIL